MGVYIGCGFVNGWFCKLINKYVRRIRIVISCAEKNKKLEGNIDMALSQMQIIQSLGEAMNWLERELNWGVAAGELRHLMGRIGELYVAMITNGQMAINTNEKGYDVVSKQGERISVKTTTMTENGHVSFNPNTLSQVDRVIILLFNTKELEIEILLDKNVKEAMDYMSQATDGKKNIALSKLRAKQEKHRSELSVNEAIYGKHKILELESGTIEVYENDRKLEKSYPELVKIASELHISTLNSKGNSLNTRQLGTLIIKTIVSLQTSLVEDSDMSNSSG